MHIWRMPSTQLVNDRSGEVICMPPEGETRLRDPLVNWERFPHNETELDPLTRMTVGHYQFEASHPFVDGNGRESNILFLIQEEVRNPAHPLPEPAHHCPQGRLLPAAAGSHAR